MDVSTLSADTKRCGGIIFYNENRFVISAYLHDQTEPFTVGQIMEETHRSNRVVRSWLVVLEKYGFVLRLSTRPSSWQRQDSAYWGMVDSFLEAAFNAGGSNEQMRGE